MRRRFVVSGVVQGVGFRYSVVQWANELSLRGTVKNLSDGSVEVEAEGSSWAVRRLVERLRRGPRGARVQGVKELPPRERELPSGPFTIER